MSRDIKMGMLIMLVGIGIFLLFVLVQPRNTPYQDPTEDQEPITAAAVETVLAATSKSATPARVDLDTLGPDAGEADGDGESGDVAAAADVIATADNEALPPVPRTPASPVRPATPAGASRTYEIEKGDTYWSIAEAMYGDAKKYVLLEKANPDVDPAKLPEGMTITIPEAGTHSEATGTRARETATVSASARAAASTQGNTAYVVEKNDTLYGIARKFYNNASLYKIIYEANKDKIKNPNNVPAGIEIVIPQHN